ncbi:tRNA (adenine(58)-N(1))-methyltransferase non-catalytic subunit TRM6 [Trichomonascus vanleenenianus]|uniref:tRNA 1-methyladenosine methyltransferase subunit GCD10 n=1 Tax=Trichomonascus vanleenenianus TaxID=2268995 RepID=UPI003ECB05E7
MDFDRSRIEANKYVLIRLPSENFRVVKLIAGQTVSLGKFGSFNVDDIIGHPFGFTYEIGEDRALSIVKNDFVLDNEDSERNEVVEAISELLPHENNRELLDDPNVQALDMHKIEELKKQGLSGQEIIELVTKSHSAFEKKTAFSKEKYIKRKQQKFLQQFTPEAIGSTELVEYYLNKDPAKIVGMSVESLALMLNMANIQPGGTYLVVDDVCGVLVAALMERMGGEGTILLAHENEHYNLDALKYMNYSDETLGMIKTITWLDFFYPEEYDEFTEKSEEDIKQLKQSAKSQYYKKRQRHADYLACRALVDAASFDALVVASTLDLTTLIPKLLPSVGGSRPIVAYHEYKELLVRLAHTLTGDLRVIAPTVMETKVRPYQTLPGRMHPHMTGRGGGGYVLWGTRVYPAEVQASGRGGANRNKKPKLEQPSEA